ncbi:MAG: PilZ domain-containing protein [Candidatus Omnitrophota bacterium]
MKERRRFPRYDHAIEVRYSTPGIAAIEGYTVSKNISRVGLRMPITRIVKEGDVINLDIEPKHKEGPVSATGKVVWTRPINRLARLEMDAGVEFIKIDHSRANRLFESVY